MPLSWFDLSLLESWGMTLSHKEAWQSHNIPQLIEVIAHAFEMQIFLVGGGEFGIHFLFFSTNQCWRRSRDWERWHWHLIPQGPRSILRLRGQACSRKRPSGISNKREVKEVLNNHKTDWKQNKQTTKSRHHTMLALWRSHENVLCFRAGGSKNRPSNYTVTLSI